MHNEHRETGTNGGEINRVVTTPNYCPKYNNRKTSYFEWKIKKNSTEKNIKAETVMIINAIYDDIPSGRQSFILLLLE